MFIDKAAITVRAGKGGDGAVAFHREKFVAAGGPDGGDGGRGGSVVVVSDDNMSTLMDFRYKRKYVAQNGVNGQGRKMKGRDGEDVVIKVPRGTLIRDRATDAIIHDMSDSQPFVLSKGGRGGWGNQHFATPTRQVPRFAKPGTDGEVREVVLELKLLADVGLVGFPNVGKSTLLSVVSKAHPKIANYHFTTLYPNLGVVYVTEGVSFVMADIPGIIEGASEGAGLGQQILHLPAAVLAAQRRDDAVGAAVRAALGNAQIGPARSGRDDAPQLRVRQVDVAVAAQPLALERGFDGLDDVAVAAGAERAVDLGQFLREFVLIALHEAAGRDDALEFSGLFELREREDRVNGLALGALDKAAGVYDDAVGFLRFADKLKARVGEKVEHLLAVDQILRAPE